MSASILTLTMNPALDLFTELDRVLPGHKLRCGPALMHPGGGGINVARVIRRLGGDVQALYLAGGVTGEVLGRLLQEEQVPSHCIAIAGETRESFTAHERLSGQDFRFLLPGPTLSQIEWSACLDHIEGLQPQPAYLVASGSLPPGVPDDFYARLARQSRSAGTRFVLDSSGPALAAALEVGVHLFKPSLRELSELCGTPLRDEQDWCEAARRLVLEGQAEIVALSLGEQGALLVDAERMLRAQALQVDVHSTIGAGDSFVAALVHALAAGGALELAFEQAMAAGAAALSSAGTALCDPAALERLRGQVRIHAL